MKTVLNYNYNLFPNEITKTKKGYYFYINEIKHYIVNIRRPIEEINLIAQVNERLEQFTHNVYKILPNNKNMYHFEYENDNYIVIKVLKNENEIIDLIDLTTINALIKTNKPTLLNRNEWNKLWTEKIDHFEYTMSLLTEESPLVNGCFSYYIGLAENAVSYFNDTFLEERIPLDDLYLSHKRILYPTVSSNIYNPLNFIFDYKVRDIAEYIKTQFFRDKIDWDEIIQLFKTKSFSRADYRLLYARLLFPSYFFDAYEQYMLNKDETKLKNIVSKSKEYEKFLFDMYYLIKNYFPIPEVEWILKNKKV